MNYGSGSFSGPYHRFEGIKEKISFFKDLLPTVFENTFFFIGHKMSVINWPPGSGSGSQDYGSADRTA
jgi:hypothetical protein